MRGWAGVRQERAGEVLRSHEVYRGDTAFNTQPGHLPLRARVNAQDDRAYESLRKAELMESRASGIDSQLAHAIYSDDPDAVPALEARIAKLESRRDQVNADNAAFRKAVKAAGLPKVATWKAADFQGHHQHEDFVLKNLSGDIKRNRDRLAQLRGGQSCRRGWALTRRSGRPRYRRR